MLEIQVLISTGNDITWISVLRMDVPVILSDVMWQMVKSVIDESHYFP